MQARPNRTREAHDTSLGCHTRLIHDRIPNREVIYHSVSPRSLVNHQPSTVNLGLKTKGDFEEVIVKIHLAERDNAEHGEREPNHIQGHRCNRS